MKVTVNDELMTLTGDETLSDLLHQLQRHQPGTALALNHAIVPRERWPHTRLQQGDELVIFQAIAGG